MNGTEPKVEQALPARPKSKRKIIVIAAIVVSIIVVIAAVVVWLGTSGAPLRIAISLSPEAPRPNERFTVTAQVEGGGPLSPVDVVMDCMGYANGSEGNALSEYRSGNRWSLELDGFPDGSEVWIFVVASTANQAPIFEDLTVSIGNVLHGGPSGLAISNFNRTPERVAPLDMVKIAARVTSAANLSRVELFAVGFFWKYSMFGGSSSQDGGGGPMLEESPGNYALSIHPPGPNGFERGTIWIYKVVAWDETWNTAATQVETFIIE